MRKDIPAQGMDPILAALEACRLEGYGEFYLAFCLFSVLCSNDQTREVLESLLDVSHEIRWGHRDYTSPQLRNSLEALQDTYYRCVGSFDFALSVEPAIRECERPKAPENLDIKTGMKAP